MEASDCAQPEPENALGSNERNGKNQIEGFRPILDSEDMTNNGGNTALHVAARKKMVNKIKLELQDKLWNEMVNSKNKDGHTPLHISCVEWDGASAKVLLDNGADINATDVLGLTPLHRAIIVQGILEDGTDDAIGGTSLVQLLLTEGTDKKLNIHMKSFHQGATALHLAAVWGLTDVVKLLIKRGADKHSTTWSHETVLHWALRTMREDEESHPERMVPYPGGNYVTKSGDRSLDENEAPTGNSGIARYGLDMISALVSTEEQERWKELLRIAYQEEDESMVRYSARRLLPHMRNKEKELVELWLAMRPERYKRLKIELLNEVPLGDRGEWGSWNVLDLAAHHGHYEVVRWLLKSNRWSRKEKRDAEGRVLDRYRTNKWETVWDVPFLQDGRKRHENYRYPQRSEDNSFTAKFQSSIVNFYSSGRYTHFLHHLCSVRDLLYNGKKGPLRIVEERVKAFKEAFSELNTENYDDSHVRFRWIHLPVNCMEWMKVATTSSYKDKENNIDHFTATNQFLLQSWHELPENSYKDKYMNPTCLRNDASGSNAMWSPQPGDTTSDELALYMPYVTFARPTDETNEREEKLRSAEKGKTRIIHRLKTLDTYHLGTTNEEEARARDAQQVVFRHAREKICDHKRKTNREIRIEDTEIPVLHVGQLWLWVIDENTVVTSETHNSHDDYSPIFGNILDYLNDNTEQLGRDIVPASLDSFVKFITSFYINTPFNLSVPLAPQLDEERESLHSIFLSSIERVNSKEGELRRKFKQEMHNQDDGKKIKGERTLHRSVTETIELLSEIKDIEQELNIISSVILIQKNVWDQLTNRPGEPNKLSGVSQDNESKNWARGTEPAQYVLRRISDLLRFAEETQKNIESILDLKMNQLSLLQAEEAGRQGSILMVFTTVTVVFTPLSFLSALFALNISIFPHSGTDLLYQPGWLFGILFGVTVGFIALVLAAVYRYKLIKKRPAKEPRKRPGAMDHRVSRTPQLTRENYFFGVLERAKLLRKRGSARREVLPTTTRLPDK
ncbi:hypothetical protein F5B21DRAFT_122673 [Xylaria acuta]|nr:hypothetical protein F5B21DRAFT_122673 [Xylaria acuta]